MTGIELVCVNYRTPHDLATFCHSVLDASPETDWHLSVVNVETTRADAEMLDRIKIRFAEAGLESRIGGFNELDNVGYARACNAAAARAAPWDHDYLAFFNADVTLPARAVDEMVKAMTAFDWGVAGPRQIDSKGRLTHAGIFGTMAAPKHRAWRGWDGVEYHDIRPAVTVSGSAYFVRRTLWDQLTECPLYRKAAPHARGAFLPTLHYFEETYCSYHAQAHGSKVMYYGPVCIQHEWHQASPVGGWAERQFPISQKYFREACDIHGIAHD